MKRLLIIFALLGVVGTAGAFAGGALPGPTGELSGLYCRLTGGTGCVITGTAEIQGAVSNTSSSTCAGNVGMLCFNDTQGATVYNGSSAATWLNGQGILFTTNAGVFGHGYLNGLSTSLLGSVALMVTSPAALSGDVNDYASTTSYMRVDSGAAARNITGIARTGALHNEILVVCAIGANTITLVHESASSVAANRFKFPAAANRVIAVDECVNLIYDTTTARWRKVN